MSLHPELWEVLTRGPNAALSNKWKDKISPCPDKTAVQNCDEYPFFATVQGGPFVPPAHPQADLRNIDATQNQMQGSYLGGFFLSCRVPIGGDFLVHEGPFTKGFCGKA
jgi:Deoxyribonuclease NucA/NucB